VEELRAAVVGGDLRLQVRLDVAEAAAAGRAWVLGGLRDEALDEAVAVVLAGAHDLERRHLRALVEDGLARRWHAARQDPAYVGVMAARRREEQDVLLRLVEDGRDDGDVGQVCVRRSGRVSVGAHERRWKARRGEESGRERSRREQRRRTHESRRPWASW